MAMQRVQETDVFVGFQSGAFGRDSYERKVCIATGTHEGEQWALFRGDHTFYVLSGRALHTLEKFGVRGDIDPEDEA